MKAKFRRTDALLLLPILLLGGVGYWQQQRARKLRAPTRIVVRSVEILPPTPSDIARGFDTRVKLSVGYAGMVPRGWGVTDWQKFSMPRITPAQATQEQISGRKKIALRELENRYDAKNDLYRGTYILKLREVSSDLPVTLSGCLEVSDATFNVTPSLLRKMEALRWKTMVRRAGVKTSVPHASHFTGLKLKGLLWSTKYRGMPLSNFYIQITSEITPGLVDERPALNRIKPLFENIYIANPQGKRFPFQASTTSTNSVQDTSIGGNSVARFSYYNWKNLPAKTSDLTFHAQISVDDLWPLEINIPVKDIPREP